MLSEVLNVIIYETLAEAFFLCAPWSSYSKNACMHAVLSLRNVIL